LHLQIHHNTMFYRTKQSTSIALMQKLYCITLLLLFCLQKLLNYYCKMLHILYSPDMNLQDFGWNAPTKVKLICKLTFF